MNIAKGRGIATNIPESELIKQVKMRPLLYDKNDKEYRKSDHAWVEVATALNSSVSNCKKRWKSLRDTFIKYFRIEQMQDKSRDIKKRKWHFYNDLRFLQPHVELFRLDREVRTEEFKDETIPLYLKEDFIEVHGDGEKHFFFEEGSPEGDAVRYQIKIDQDYEETVHNEEELLENFVEEPRDDDQHIEEDSGNKSEKSEYVIVEEPTEKLKCEPSSACDEVPQKNITDPDERYLLSCLPALKRLSPQQKALVRIGIEKLFYEVEFETEPLMKKFKNS